MAPNSSTLAWKIPWMEEPGRLQSMGSLRVGHDWATSLSLFTFHFHALEKEMATHSSVLAWRTPGTGEPDGLPSMGSHRVGHDWSNLAAGAAAYYLAKLFLHLTGFSQSKFSASSPQIYTYTKLSTLTQIECRLSRGQCQYWGQNTGVIRILATLVLLGLAVLLRATGQIIKVWEAYSKLRGYVFLIH